MKEYLPAFSLKAMFVLVLAASVASFAIASHNFAVAVGLMLCVAVSLVLIAGYAVWTRRPRWLLLVACSVGYLILADGGVFPRAERYLPTELALERCSRGHTVLLNGVKFPRSFSLTQWAWRMCSNPNHGDWRHVFWKQHAAAYKNRLRNSSADVVDTDESVDANLDSLLEIVDQGNDSQDVNPMVVGGVRLPAIALTSISVVIECRNRDQAQNRAFYISGHCLVVLFALAIAVWWSANRRPDSTN